MGVRFADDADYHDSNAILLHRRAFFYDPIELPAKAMLSMGHDTGLRLIR